MMRPGEDAVGVRRNSSRATQASLATGEAAGVASVPPRALVAGVGISLVDPAKATQTVVSWIQNRDRHYVTVTSVHGVIEANKERDFTDILAGAGMSVPDGMPLVWLCRLRGHSQIRRVCGPDFMLTLSGALAPSGARMFYYGGTPGVADELAASLERRYPGLQTAGIYCPPFRALTADEEDQIAERINATRPDVVWVGLSTPKQERWMAAFRDRLEAPVLIGVGAAFDYNTGRIRRAHPFIQMACLEWAYRLSQDPRRLWKRYARNNPTFIYYVVSEMLGLRSGTRAR